MLPTERPRLVAMMPGSLMYRVEPAYGPSRIEPEATRQVRCLASSSSFSGVPEAELLVLLESIAQSIGRAYYHFQRFRFQRHSLDELRSWAPGEIFFEEAVFTMHYEMQALAGAARLLVDEVVFLIAKRHGHDHQNWAAWSVLHDPIAAGASTDKLEVHRLRTHRDWFVLLNSYRNAFFHRGWKQGSGHFDRDGRRAAELPSMNALLVPDRASLRNPAYNWTYNDRCTIDDVCDDIYQGLIAMIGDLCANEWGTPVPPPGTMTEDQRPNLMVALATPIIVSMGDSLLAPIFSSRERAVEFTRAIPGLSAAANTSLELLEIRSSPDVVPPAEMLAFSFIQLPSDHGAELLKISFDPVLQGGVWSETISASLPLKDLLKDQMRIAGVEVPAPTTAYVWRTPFLLP